MGLNLKRTAMAAKNTTDRYQGSFACNKSLDEALEYVRGYCQPKVTKKKYRGFNYHTGAAHVTKDTNMNVYWEIQIQFGVHKLGDMGRMTVYETYGINLKYRSGVVYEVALNLNACDSKACFDDFKDDFLEAIPDLKGPAPQAAPQIAVAVDFTGVSMLQALESFDKVIDQFGANVNESSFKKLRAFKYALTNKINSLPFQEKGKFSQPMGQIDMFVSTMEGQFANPAMASSVASFAGTYVAQMKAAVGSMASMA